MPIPKVAIRTSTLATLDVVETLPVTVSPEWTVVSLIETARIFGGASGCTLGTATCLGEAVATGTLVSTGVGVAVGIAVGACVGDGVAEGAETGRVGVRPGDDNGAPDRDGTACGVLDGGAVVPVDAVYRLHAAGTNTIIAASSIALRSRITGLRFLGALSGSARGEAAAPARRSAREQCELRAPIVRR
jgi:hypothetical protein